VKKYLDDLKTALNETKRFTEAEINDIVADHEEMIGEALASGLAEADIESKFGNPRKVAADLLESKGGASVREPKPESAKAIFAGVPPSGTIGITIRLASDDVSITAETRDDVAVYCDRSVPAERYEIGFLDKEFVIRMKKGDVGTWFHRGAIAFDVRIPLAMSVGDVLFQQASGDYAIAGVKAASLKINTASGDGDIADGSFERIEIGAVNGDLRLARLIVGDVSISQVSGDLSVMHLVCEGDLSFTSTSGDVEIVDSVCANAIFHTVSGDFEGTEFYPETIAFHSVNGDVEINNADRSRPITVKSSKTVSGTIRIREK